MKRWLLLLLLCVSVVAAEERGFDASLFDAADLLIKVEVSSAVTLSGSGSAEKLEATVYYLPEEANRIVASPTPVSTQPLIFSWRNIGAGKYPFEYSSEVHTVMNRPLIHDKIDYPFSTPSQFTEYLQPQQITDTNAQIRKRTQEITAGKTDSMEVVFALADWVHNNVDYNLSTFTAEASQPSSWVYAQRYGVCDEITSLFISMSREAGIPARFVSGIAYTNSEQFSVNWGPHGWAEVWLPEVGWIPVDVTYGEIGYVDATHIPIRHSIDAKNTAVDYSLLSRGVTMEATELDVVSSVIERGREIHEPLELSIEPLYDEVGSDSSNRITATVENNADYYIATDLYLVTTAETRLHEKQQQRALLPPHSTREVSWRVTHEDFQAGYEYTIPFAVIAKRAGNASTTVIATANGKKYPLIADTAVVSGIPIDCESAPLLYVGEAATVTCRAPGATLCADSCGKDSIIVSFVSVEAGAFPQIVTATNRDQKGSAIVTFVVDEDPQPRISATIVDEANFEDTVTLSFTVSTSKLDDVHVRVIGNHFIHSWDVEEVTSKGFELRFPATYLNAGTNELQIVVEGEDKNGNTVRGDSEVPITLHATTWQKLHLFMLHLFT